MISSSWQLASGATPLVDGTTLFHVWAPAARSLALKLWRGQTQPQLIPMQRQCEEDGFWCTKAEARSGDLYQYLIDSANVGELTIPDPVSRLLPEGVHGRTEIVDPNAFNWTDDAWRGIAIEQCVFYELHIGTFTPEGTLDAAIARLDYLRDLGITAIELMPVNAFPGTRNWGYDGVGLYAVQASYGGPEALRRFVNAAHARGLAVVLDVVYNHLGNEGNYLRAFGAYFTHRHNTPWGDAINFDGVSADDLGSEGVRRFFVENALYWISEYHLDGVRLDAVQTIKDDSREHIVAEIARRAHALGKELGRHVLVIPETDEDLARYALPVSGGGFGCDGFWSDDFHHCIHALLTGESHSYYQDFSENAEQLLVRVLNEGYAFQGEYFQFWEAERGSPTQGLPLPANVICTQNHDQVGNRALGERLSVLAPRGANKLAAALLLLAPHTPLLFMGQEYGEEAPFQFFTDFKDPVIQKAVTEGRPREFPHFDPNTVPDPQSPATFERSRLSWNFDDSHRDMLEWHRALLRMRRECVTNNERTCHAEWRNPHTLVMQVPAKQPEVVVVASFEDRTNSPLVDWKPPANFELRLANAENGFEVRVYQRT